MGDPQLVYDVARVLEGEAAVMGLPGMVMVLWSMWSRLLLGGEFTLGATGDVAIECILDAYRGDAEPSETALFAAWFLVNAPDDIPKLVAAAGMMPFTEPTPFCMSAQDVARRGWRMGDVVMEGPKGYELHLYQRWPRR